MTTATLAEELCPECGQFVQLLHEVSGFCSPCSEELGYGRVDPKSYMSNLMRYLNQFPAGDRSHRVEACARGHRFIEGNIAFRKDGTRKCPECDRQYSAAKRVKQRKELKNPESKLHGTNSAVKLGCKCAKCQPAREIYNQKRRGKPR